MVDFLHPFNNDSNNNEWLSSQIYRALYNSKKNKKKWSQPQKLGTKKKKKKTMNGFPNGAKLHDLANTIFFSKLQY